MQPYDTRAMAARLASQAPSQATYLPTRQQSPPPQRRISRPATPPTPDSEPDSRKSFPLGKESFLLVGLIVLIGLCALPIWEAWAMLTNFDYKMWGDLTWPRVVIFASLGLIALFFLMTVIIFWRWGRNVNASQTLMMTTSLVITLLGIMMVIVSFPLAQNAIKTHNDITYNCFGIEQAREIRSEYAKLLALRTTPACAAQYTIEACEGYNANSSLINYIKTIESTYSCSGFCHQPAGAALVQSLASASDAAAPAMHVNLLRQGRRARGAGTKASALQQDQRLIMHEASHGEVSAVTESEASNSSSAFPPALFSISNYTKSCDGAIARNMVNVTHDMAMQLWYTGIIIIILSLCTSMKEWSSKFLEGRQLTS